MDIRKSPVLRQAWLRKPVVLIAEDNADVREMTKSLLELEGCLIIEAENGSEAVQRAELAAPDLILLDIRMPVMDGLEATRRLRQSPRTRDIPIIALTGTHENRLDALEAGCNNCLYKPLLAESIGKLLANYCHIGT